MKRFINVPQGKTCRYDSKNTPAEIQGLYTDNFSICNIVILSKNEGDHLKISMTHADYLTETNQIQAELDWIGSNAQGTIITKGKPTNNSISKKLPQHIKNRFTTISVEKDTFGLTVDQKGLKYCDRMTVPLLATHPLEWALHSIYILNTLLNPNITEIDSITLLFNGTEWGSLSTNDLKLKDNATKFYDYFKNELSKNAQYSSIDAYEITFNALQDMNIFGVITKKITYEITWRSLFLYTANNYQELYNKHYSNYLLSNQIKSCMNKNSINIIEQLAKNTKNNLDDFLLYTDTVQQLPQNIQPSLNYNFKWCKRAKQHDTAWGNLPALDLHQNDNLLQRNGLFAQPTTLGCEPPPGSYQDEIGRTIVP